MWVWYPKKPVKKHVREYGAIKCVNCSWLDKKGEACSLSTEFGNMDITGHLDESHSSEGGVQAW